MPAFFSLLFSPPISSLNNIEITVELESDWTSLVFRSVPLVFKDGTGLVFHLDALCLSIG